MMRNDTTKGGKGDHRHDRKKHKNEDQTST